MKGIILNLLQNITPKTSYMLLDNPDPKAQPVDCLTLARKIRAEGKKVYYAIHKDNKMVGQLRKEFGKNLITFKRQKPKSVRKKLFWKLITAKYMIESFHCLCYKDMKNYAKKTEFVFAQHGVNFFKGLWHVPLDKEHYDKIIISSPTEEKLFLERGFEQEDFIKAGLPRWDLIKDDSKHGIFIYFTFRNTFSEKRIEETIYYKRLVELVLELSKRFPNEQIYVGVHHVVRSIVQNLKIKNVRLVNEHSIDKIKNKTRLLITDYSSMSFDYLVKNKPVVFYRLDNDDNTLNEHDLNINQYANEQDNFIFNVCYSKTTALNKVKYYVENKYQLENNYIKRLNTFFYARENVCNAIINQLDSKND